MPPDEKEVRLARVAAIRAVATDILCYDLSPGDRRPFEPWEPGAHLDVHTPGGPVRQYSLCGDPRQPTRYTIAVKNEPQSRGGSRSMHGALEVGAALGISGPRNHFPLSKSARRLVFIAGGIGITPIYPMIQAAAAQGREWSLAYCARSEAHAAFYQDIRRLPGGRVMPHFSEKPTLDAGAMLYEVPQGTHVYCCGPQGLMRAVADATTHWPGTCVHFEYFSAPAAFWPPNRAFEIELARSGEVLAVPADKTILQVVREHGIDVHSACEEGVCGTCETRLLGGQAEHRDVLLSPREKELNCTMMVCVSRAKSPRLVLDL
jgi:ferredoxin-NADP reductase